MTVGFTMPDAAPLYPKLPYQYVGYSRFSVFCRVGTDVLASLLPSAFTPTDERFEAFFMDAPTVHGLRPYAETGIVIPCRYRNIDGAHVAFEYVTTDDALCVGREVWGYPKKLADIATTFAELETSGSCVRDGTTLMAATFERVDVDVDVPSLHPRLQMRRLPEADGTRRDQVVRNDLGAAATHSTSYGTATISFAGELSALSGCEVVAGVVTRGDFTLDYGQVVGTV